MYLVGTPHSGLFHCLITFLFYSHTASFGAIKSLQAKSGLKEPPNYYGSQKFMKTCIPLGKEKLNKISDKQADELIWQS